MHRHFLVGVVTFLLVITGFSFGQQATTSVRGTISDPNGAVLPNATVTINNPSTGFTRSVKTDSQGLYQALQLPPGTYMITAEAPGFSTVKADNIRLLVSTPGTVNLSMRVAEAQTTVEVSGETPLVNTQDATIGNAFGTAQIASLPFEGRDPVGILSLQPGVAFVGNNVDQSYDSRGGSVNGARSDQTNVTLDGVDNNDQNSGFAFQGALRSTLDSLQEFRVTTTNANADAGRSSGAQVSLVTKSGTNNWHGSVYEYHRPTFTTANDWFNKQAQLRAGEPNRAGKLLRNTFGASIGGPVKKDRLFFFATYEGQRTRETTQITRTVPSALLRQGVLQYLDDSGNVVQLTPQQFASMDPKCSANGSCPLGPGADPAALAVMNQYPLPNNTAGAGDGLNFQGYTFAAPTPSKLDTYIAKLDANLTSHQTVYIRGNLQNDHFVPADATSAPQFLGEPANVLERNNSKGLALGHTWTITNSLINNFRYGYIRQGIGSAGLQTTPFVEFRGMDPPVGFSKSSNITVPVHNFVDDVSWTKGNHTIQFGGNWRRITDERLSNGQSFFHAITNPSWLDNASIANNPGSSLDPANFGFPAVSGDFQQSYDLSAAALAGLVTEVDSNYNATKTGDVLAQGTPVHRRFRSNEFEMYLQDAWHIKNNLTITAGARYTLLQPPYETSGQQVAPNQSLNDWFNKRAAAQNVGQTYAPVISFQLSGQANGKPPMWDWSYGDIAPRVAIAYSPGGNDGLSRRLFGGAGKTSIRLGYGMFYDHFGEGVVNSFDELGAFGLTTGVSNPAGIQDVDTVPRFTGITEIPQSLVTPPPGLTPPIGVDNNGFAITWGLDNKLKTPYAHVFDFSITRELPKGFVFESSYVGRLGRRLLQEEDLAMPLDLRDPKSGMDYFTAATMLAKAAEQNVPFQSMASIPYFENLFPGAAGAGTAVLSGCAAGVPVDASGAPTFTGHVTATQAMYDSFACNLHNETSALYVADVLGFPSPSVLGPYAYFDAQYSSLYAWRSIGTSSYNGAQFTLRHRTDGLQFDFNYTFSKSIDLGSNAERINTFQNFGFASQVINSWNPKQLRAVSDFDTTHQINSNWVWDVPVGRGRHFLGGMNGVSEALVGGWSLSGIFRWSSGYPFTIAPGLGFWPTNWELTSSTFLNGKAPRTGAFIDSNGDPNAFKDPKGAIGQFRFAYPGESGQRNELRGPGVFGVDMGLAKTWKLTERQALKFSWETFNVTNTPRFDVGSLQFVGNNSISSAGSFGKYTKTLSTPRIMQFALRYSF